MRAGGLTGTAAADGGFDARAPVGGAVGPGCSRAAVATTALGVALPAGLTRRVDGRGAVRLVRVRRDVGTSPEPFVWVLRASSPTQRLFLTRAVMCS
ncbi:hypothetical protein GCM10023320_03630 [Pseudonocardia adelaidensis]|uniref:Uncharacterized protein n=1 Tax=Pseudonocardia adelaidensis TaxID=648754 RepID=A0ABP9N733_9PSEU